MIWTARVFKYCNTEETEGSSTFFSDKIKSHFLWASTTIKTEDSEI
jgi:hypothetical protein